MTDHLLVSLLMVVDCFVVALLEAEGLWVMFFAGTAVVTEEVLDLLLAALGAAHWGVVPVVGRDTKGSSGVILLLDALWVMVLLALAEVAKNLLGLFLDQLEVALQGGMVAGRGTGGAQGSLLLEALWVMVLLAEAVNNRACWQHWWLSQV